ncbi:hypothetical protein BKA82DRAFT_4362269 [Pisolithus tinctorius]|nr:hypothetical protein BKA82DRAFT_4362269 [Pisolithus tinctorius]
MEQQQYNSGGESLITDQSLQSDQGTVDQGQVYYGQQDMNAGFISGEQHFHESGQYQGNSGDLLYSSESGQYQDNSGGLLYSSESGQYQDNSGSLPYSSGFGQYQDNSGGLPYSSGFGQYQDNSGGLLYPSESGQNQENSGGLLYYSESGQYQDNGGLPYYSESGPYQTQPSSGGGIYHHDSQFQGPGVPSSGESGLQRIMSMTLPPTLEDVSRWLSTEGHDNQYIMDGQSNHPENISGEYPLGFYPPFHMVPGDSGTQHTGESTEETGGWKKNEGEAGWTFHPPPPGSYVDHDTLKNIYVPVPYEGEYIPPQGVIDDQTWAQLTGAPHWKILMGDRLVTGTTPLISFAQPAEARDHPHSRRNLNWPNSEKFGSAKRHAEQQFSSQLLLAGIDIPKGEQTAMAHAVLERTVQIYQLPRGLTSVHGSEQFADVLFDHLRGNIRSLFRVASVDFGITTQLPPRKGQDPRVQVAPNCEEHIRNVAAEPYAWCHRTFNGPTGPICVKFIDLRIDLYFVKVLLWLPELTLIWLANSLTDFESFTIPIRLISHVVYSLQWALELDMDKGNNLKHYMSKRGNSAVDRGNSDSEAAILERYADLELGIGDAFLDHQWALMNKTRWYQVMKQIQNALCPV